MINIIAAVVLLTITPLSSPNAEYVPVEKGRKMSNAVTVSSQKSSTEGMISRIVKLSEVVRTVYIEGSKDENSGIGIVKYSAKSSPKYLTVIDSFPLPRTQNNGLEWDGRYLWMVSGNGSSSASTLNAIDPEDGSVYTSWDMPTTGNCMGIAFVNDLMYVSDWTNGNIVKVDKQGNYIATYSSPGGTYVRGISSDGLYLYLTKASSSTDDSLYKVDTLMNIISSWEIGGIIGWPMDIVYVSKDGTVWINDDDTHTLKQIDISGSVPLLLNEYSLPGNPVSNYEEGIAFDGSDLWFNTFFGSYIYRLDVGYSLARIALFQDQEPWGFRSTKDILYDNGIPFKVFTSSDMGVVDLSIYTKAVISSQQPYSFYQAIESNRSWWENWINNGLVFELNGAEFSGDDWSGLIMPGGFTSQLLSDNVVDIASVWHPIVTTPYSIDDDSLDGWNSSTHGYFINLPAGYYTVISDSISGEPAAVIFRMGSGGVIATMQPLEFAWGYSLCPVLENFLKYWLYGVSPNVLMAIADYDMPSIRYELETYSDIGNVDHMNLSSYIPTMADLSLYDAIFAWPNYSPLDPTAVGDTFAAYVDGGKWVITCGWSWYTNGNHFSGAIMTPTYNPFSSLNGQNHYATANLGWYEASHPIMNGVTAVSDRYRDYLVINAGADSVAKWDDDEWFIGTKASLSGGGVVGFNGVPADYGNWTGDMMLLLHNALVWTQSVGVGEDNVIRNIQGIKLLGATKNPFTTSTNIVFEISSPGEVTLHVYNIVGQLITSVSRYERSAGKKSLTWNGEDRHGNTASPGVYFYTLEFNNRTVSGKLTIVR